MSVTLLLDRFGGVVAEDIYRYFVAALRHELGKGLMPQNVLAEKIGCSDQHLNAIYRERVDKKTGRHIRASGKLQQNVAEAFGYSFVDFLKLGENLLENKDGGIHARQLQPTLTPAQSLPIPGVQANHVDPTAVMSAVSTLVGQYSKLDERMRFWRLVFDELPVSVLVIRDGSVVYQNAKARVWGNICGTPLCESCTCPADCQDTHTCPVHIAMKTGEQKAGVQYIGPGRYWTTIKPIRMQDHEYFLLVATDIADSGLGIERRMVSRGTSVDRHIDQ